MTKRRSNKQSIHISVTPEEKQIIQNCARSAGMSMNEFLKQRALSYDAINVIHAGPDILGHLTKLSNYINLIEHNDLRKEITLEVQEIWRYLNQ
jgi:hypothetical protein